MPSFVSGKCNVVLVTRTTDDSRPAFVSANLEGKDIWYGAKGLCVAKCYTEWKVVEQKPKTHRVKKIISKCDEMMQVDEMQLEHTLLINNI
jgi:hypothetical protein